MAAVSGIDVRFFSRNVVDVARELLGMRLCRRSRRGLTAGLIVETEAYLAAGDSAAHSFRGPNRKNAAMFGPAGRAYVYTIHARQCVNVVTEQQGQGSAVLIRAVEPTTGIELMQARRGLRAMTDLCRGPARLCEAFDIGRDLNGWSLTENRRLWIEPSEGSEPLRFATSPRIGVTSAHDRLLRFFVPDNNFVSGPKRLNRGID